jgi:hypothetical protein
MSAIRRAKQQFLEVSERMNTVMRSLPDDWQQQLVRLRLELRQVIALLSDDGVKQVAALGDAALLREFEDALARYRTAMVLLQAERPVVGLDPQDPQYVADRNRYREVFLTLIAIMDKVLARKA